MCTLNVWNGNCYVLTLTVQTYVFNNIKKASTRKDQIELLVYEKQDHDQNTEAERSTVFRRERNKLKNHNIIH